MNEHREVMVDLETMSTKKNAIIVSIGAVGFGPSTRGGQQQPIPSLGNNFYQVCSAEDQKSLDRHISPETMEWWESKSPEARSALDEAHRPDAKPLAQVLNEFVSYLGEFDNPHIWSEGADFDVVILENAMEQLGISIPWEHHRVRCFRTLKSLGLQPKSYVNKRDQIAHHGLGDAIYQARAASVIIGCKQRGV